MLPANICHVSLMKGYYSRTGRNHSLMQHCQREGHPIPVFTRVKLTLQVLCLQDIMQTIICIVCANVNQDSLHSATRQT